MAAFSRRRLLGSIGLGGVGLAAAGCAPATAPARDGVAFRGAHQAGISTDASFTMSTPSSSASPGTSAARTFWSSRCASSGSKLPMLEPM